MGERHNLSAVIFPFMLFGSFSPSFWVLKMFLSFERFVCAPMRGLFVLGKGWVTNYLIEMIGTYKLDLSEMLQLNAQTYKYGMTNDESQPSRDSETNPIQCVPIKRKPVLSVRYLHCHARLKQTVCFIIKSIFSSFIWYQTHNDISMHEWKGTI